MMRRALILAFVLALASPCGAAEKPITVPSGQDVRFVEMVSDTQGPEGLTYRFRFIAPAIARDGGTVDAEAALADMQALCDSFALDRIAVTGPQPSQVIISLADRDVPFGEPSPDATQFFEAFHPEDGACVWDGF